MNVNQIGRVVAIVVASILLACAAPASRADGGGAGDLTISIDGPIADTAGGSLTVFGTLTNTSSSTLYFSDDSVNINGSAPLLGSDDIIINGIFGLGPVSIAPGASLTDVDLFTLEILTGATPGNYGANSFVLFGGDDATACGNGTVGCDNQLGAAAFSATVQGQTTATTPEPATFALLGVGLGALALIGLRNRRAGNVGVE